MIIQLVTFESDLSEEEVVAKAKERAGQYRALKGLIQKYYVKLAQPERYGGLYLWDSRESLAAFRESELAATIAREYKVKGKPVIETLETMFTLREGS